MRPERAEQISHLTPDQIEELYQRYRNGEKNKDLIEEYGIQIDPNSLIKIIPPLERPDELCPYCVIPMFSRRKSKTGSAHDKARVECFDCDHREYSAPRYGNPRCCRCSGCAELRSRQEAVKEEEARRTISAAYAVDLFVPVPYSALSFTHKLYLLTLFRVRTESVLVF